MNLRLISLRGSDMLPYLDDLAQLRIAVFRDWPYLYAGDMQYERKYLKTFAESEHAFLVLALAEVSGVERVAGASTALPLIQETENIQAPFLAHNIAISDVYYFSESVLLKNYRGQGVGVGFFEAREQEARRLGFSMAAFCGVVRPDHHPLRPANHVPLDAFWRKRGFSRREGMVCYIPWKDLGEAEESPKPLHFWTKDLVTPDDP